MRQLHLTSAPGATVLLALTQATDDPGWQERARALGDLELAGAVAARPPLDAEYVRFHPRAAVRYEAALTDPAGGVALPDLTRIGVSTSELQLGDPAVQRSLWVLSYFSDPQGVNLVSRNYLRLRGPWALEAPTLAGGRWGSILQVAPEQPALEHGILYAPAELRACWLEIRLAVARGGRQRTFTLDPNALVPQLIPLTLDPLTASYQGLSAGYNLIELRPLQARNPLAPTLNAAPAQVLTRYQTSAGGGYLPLDRTPDVTPTLTTLG